VKDRPSVECGAGALELEPVAITIVDRGCAWAATFGEERQCSGDRGDAVQCRRRCGGASYHYCAPHLDQVLGLGTIGGESGGDELRRACPGTPPLLFYSTV
jgi:hypothetical protein